MDIFSAWSAKATATSTIGGQNALSFSFNGSLVFSVFLSQVTTGVSVIPQNTVLGRMVGGFDARVSTPTRQVTGNGTAGWIVGGTYDPLSETISVSIRSTEVDVKGTDAALEEAAGGTGPTALHFSTTLNWGWAPNAPRDYLGEIAWAQDPSTILDAMKAPAEPFVPSSREADLFMVNSLPQTGLNESQCLSIDLKEPKPQTLTQTFEDQTGLGNRTTTWVFTLMPRFNIERDDRPADGSQSFVSTDIIGLHMSIPGVTVPKSGWANLPSWEVKGLGPFSGNAVPIQRLHSTTFSFRPNPGSRPTGGSTDRSRPIQYTVSATINGSMEFFILTQDDPDLLRQEYIDHKEGFVPSRSDCIPHPIDNSFNVGNYRLVIDSGMQAALDKVSLEFGKEKGDVRIVSGFRCPQRNMAIGDIHPNNKHVLGRALDLAPDPASAGSLMALYQACIRAGYHSFCEAAPGREVPPGSADAHHVHIDW